MIKDKSDMNLQIFPLNHTTLKNYLQCFEKNGDKKRDEDVKWQFLENPINETFVSISVDPDSEKTAAIYAISPALFNINNDVLLGSQSLDTITDVDFRGKGLFIKLATDVYQKAKSAKVCLVYGFPNGNSIHGFTKKLEWQALDPVPFLIKPLKSSYFTSKIKFLKFLPNISLSFSQFNNKSVYKITQDFSFQDDVNGLWTRFSQHFKVAVTRDAAYLKWRYLEKPNEDYKILHCYSHMNEYLGFVVYTVKKKHGGSIGYIMELIYDPEKPEIGKLLLSSAVQAIKDLKADCILSWCMEHSPNYSVFRNNLFFNLPEKFRPIELHFGVRAFDDKIKETVMERKNWYLSYSDSDTV